MTPTEFTFHICLVCHQRFSSLVFGSEAFTQHQQDHHDQFTPDEWEL